MTTTTLTQANIDALNRLAADTPRMHDLSTVLEQEDFDLILKAAYTAYRCTMCDHECQSLTLSFVEWKATVLK